MSASSAVVNDDLPSRILSGSVQVRPGIARLTPTGVEFTDGSFVDDVAAVICATGIQALHKVYKKAYIADARVTRNSTQQCVYESP